MSLFKNKKLLLLLILLCGVFLRLYNLGDKPFHHDEALNSMTGVYYYDNPGFHYYKYNPMVHGPLLYHLLPVVYDLMGVNKVSGRILMALMGIILCGLVFVFRDSLPRNKVDGDGESVGLGWHHVFWTGILCFSPVMVYFSRYARHDYFTLISYMIFFFAIEFKPRYRWIYFFLALVIHWTAKENIYLFMPLLVGFFVYELLLSKVLYRFRKEGDCDSKTSVSQVKADLIANKKYFLWGIGLFVAVYCVLYSSFFMHIQGIIDGFFTKCIEYWWNQHKIERIKGPFIMHLLMMAWYELPVLLLVFGQLFHFYANYGRNLRYIGILFLISATMIYGLVDHSAFDAGFFRETFRLKSSYDFIFFWFLIVHSLVSTTVHLLNGERKIAFYGYFLWATFFTYSFVGEKVPWLALYPFFFAIPFLFHYERKHRLFQKARTNLKFVVPLGCAIFAFYLVRTTIRTSFTRSAIPDEYIGQVHTTNEYERIIKGIIYRARIEGITPSVVAEGNPVWTSIFAFHGTPVKLANGPQRNYKSFDYILSQGMQPDQVKETHKCHVIDYSGWFVPDIRSMKFFEFWEYAFFRTPWNGAGTLKINVCRKNEIQELGYVAY